MPRTVEDLLGQMERHLLMPSKDLEALQSRWFRPGRKGAQDANQFAEWLRVNNFLTPFALTALMQGKADQLTLNQYRLTDMLRAGPDTTDFLATDPLDRSLRVQIVAPAIAQEPERLERVRQVAQKVMAVQHYGLARVYDLCQARGISFLVSEHIEGESLDEYIKKRSKLSSE